MVGTKRLPGVSNKELRKRILRSERQIIPATLRSQPRGREAHAPDRFDLEYLSEVATPPLVAAHASPRATNLVQAQENATPSCAVLSFHSTGADLLSSPWMLNDLEDTWTNQRHNLATSARLEARVAYPQKSPRVLLQASFTEEVMPTSYPPSSADGARHAAFHGLVDGYLDGYLNAPAHTDFARVISTEYRAFTRLLLGGTFCGASVSATGEQYFPESSFNADPAARAIRASDQAACAMANECGRGHCGPPACTMAIQFGRGHDGPHALFPEHLPWGSIDAVPTARLLHEQDLKTAQFPESSLNAARPFQASDDQAACDMANECGRRHCGPPACNMAIQFGRGHSGPDALLPTLFQGPNQCGHSDALSAAGRFQDEAAYDMVDFGCRQWCEEWARSG